jgi:hypothetical protein
MIHKYACVPTETNSCTLIVHYTNMAIHIIGEVILADEKERKIKHKKDTSQETTVLSTLRVTTPTSVFILQNDQQIYPTKG